MRVLTIDITTVNRCFRRHVLDAAYNDRHYRIILAFDVRVSAEARAVAAANGVEVFEADIIYHLFDAFVQHSRTLIADIRPPCILYFLPEYPTNTAKPMVMTVRVAGELPVGSLLGAYNKTRLGVVSIIRKLDDGTPIAKAFDNDIVTITINPIKSKNSQPVMWRDFDPTEPILPYFEADKLPDFPREWYVALSRSY